MKISSVRLGHANNSSSSHSILLGSKMPPVPAETPFEYGWEWFHLVDKRDKARYMAAILYGSLPDNIHPFHKSSIIKDIIGVDLEREYFKGYSKPQDTGQPHADHQSGLDFPCVVSSTSRKIPDAAFMKEFCGNVVNNPRITIRGGNDNEDPPSGWEKDSGVRAVKEVPVDTGDILYSRKNGDWWTLYNHRTGAKVRLSFRDDAKPLTHSSTPELVDLKITDYCEGSCPFCYQSSGKAGKHASEKDVSSICWCLGQAGVFEVAIGGGEPTQHPEFTDILDAVYRNGMTPNFSSNSTDWMKNKKILDAVKEYCGSFAISNLKKIRDVIDWNCQEKAQIYSVKREYPRATLQIPLGCYDEKTTKDALRIAEEFAWDIPVTLLGFKRCGRGTSFNPFPYGWIVDFIKEIGLERFGADSVFVQEFGEDLKKAGISPTLFVDGEGAFSCYIDAVNGIIAPSSYSNETYKIGRRANLGLSIEESLKRFPFSAVNVA